MINKSSVVEEHWKNFISKKENGEANTDLSHRPPYTVLMSHTPSQMHKHIFIIKKSTKD